MGSIQEAAAIVQDATKAGGSVLRAVTTGYGRRSISRLAKDAIFQMPMAISNDIDTDDIVVIAHGFEKEYASFIVSAMSLDHDVNRNKYDTVRDFLKTYHSNSDIPAAVYNSGNLVMESVTIAEEGSVYVDPMMVASLWTSNNDRFDTDVINNMYRPFVHTTRKLRDRLEMATEASNRRGKPAAAGSTTPTDSYNKALMKSVISEQTKADALRREVQIANGGTHNTTNNFSRELGINKEKEEFYDRHPVLQDLKDDATAYGKSSRYIIPRNAPGANQVKAKESKLDMMEPTLINVNLNNYNGQTVWQDTVTLGVKCMVRLVPTGQMTANMIDAAEDRAIFKFIKWTKGELNTFDMLFGKAKYKKMGIENAKGKWMAALKKRATIDSVSRILGSRLLPNTTIVITETEAAEIKQACGVDFHDMSSVRRLMDKYFLLGFAIYDMNTRILSAVFDGDSTFTQVPMRALVADIKRSTDLLANGQRRF